MRVSKFKTCRQILENVWQTKKLTQKQKKIVSKARKKTNKAGEFSKKLQAIKKLSIFYGNLPVKKVAKKTYTYLDKQKSLLLLMEKRLDILLVRMNFCSTIFTARQLISHKKICVNNQIILRPSFQVSSGDLISIQQNCKSTIKQNIRYNRILKNKPSHLEVNYKTLMAVLLYEPQQIKFPYHIDLDVLN
jgi:small subunit ribosomal protein S4